MFKYKYTGDQEVNLPKFGITAKKGDVVESEREIDHPDFELLKEAKEQTVEPSEDKTAKK